MTKVVSLTVHKNNIEQKRRHAKSKDMVARAKELARDKDVSGFVILCYDKDERASLSYDAGHMSPLALPEFLKQKILKYMNS